MLVLSLIARGAVKMLCIRAGGHADTRLCDPRTDAWRLRRPPPGPGSRRGELCCGEVRASHLG